MTVWASCFLESWWRHQMETFSPLLALCAGNSPVPGEFPAQRPVTQSFDVFFDLRLNRRWVNNGEAGDLRCHCTHYDIIVMVSEVFLNGESIAGDQQDHNDIITWKYFTHYWPLCEGNPPVTGGFPSQRVSNVELSCISIQIVVLTMVLPVIWDAKTLMWHCNDIVKNNLGQVIGDILHNLGAMGFMARVEYHIREKNVSTDTDVWINRYIYRKSIEVQDMILKCILQLNLHWSLNLYWTCPLIQIH